MVWDRVESVVPDPAGPGLILMSSSLLFGVLSLPLVVRVREMGRFHTWDSVYAVSLSTGIWYLVPPVLLQ